uniref:Peptidase S54 rhomboid domain-containing protein n=1 Tax=Araucaria cunninghamii TaxID=56994 RepID=A0A0D6R731_ARACU
MNNNRFFQGGVGFFTGFTRLCKGLAAVLVIGYAASQIFPSTVEYLALIPGKTIPFAWNLITAGYLEQSVFGLVLSVIALLFSGKLLEPIWGSREFFKFIIVVNIFTSISVFVTTIFLYYVTRNESFLYTPLSGFHGVLSGFLVGVKQIMPDQEMTAFLVLKLRAKWLPSLLVLVSIIVSVLGTESTSYLPFIIFGTYGSWLYLRYIQRKPETNLKGDPSDEFAFSTFFPELMRPVVDAIALICEKIFCGGSQSFSEEEGDDVGGMPLPGSDPIEASRRRERGARALEERLAAAKAAEAVAVDDKSRDDATENV